VKQTTSRSPLNSAVRGKNENTTLTASLKIIVVLTMDYDVLTSGNFINNKLEDFHSFYVKTVVWK
jgi:hypothetical protein